MAAPAALRVLVGLGNPGPAYESTRHNVGFLVLEELAGRAEWVRRTEWLEAECELGGAARLLVRPLTYMNRCGPAIARILVALGLEAGNMVVVTDDIYLPWGRLRIRAGGSAGGHNGLESIVQSVGTSDFPRVRVGVGSPRIGIPLEEFVLEPLRGTDRDGFMRIVGRTADAVRTICSDGLAAGMNRFNGPSPEETVPPDEPATSEETAPEQTTAPDGAAPEEG